MCKVSNEAVHTCETKRGLRCHVVFLYCVGKTGDGSSFTKKKKTKTKTKTKKTKKRRRSIQRTERGEEEEEKVSLSLFFDGIYIYLNRYYRYIYT